jgi:hypothetical protein
MQIEHLRRLQDPDLLQTGQLSQKIDLENARRRALTALIDELVLGPIRIVRDCLGAMTYIGPLREIPSCNYRPRLSPDESRWARGLAAWDLLYTDPSGKVVEQVNTWLSLKMVALFANRFFGRLPPKVSLKYRTERPYHPALENTPPKPVRAFIRSPRPCGRIRGTGFVE